MNPFQNALSNRLVQFVNHTEQRKLTANEIEEIINIAHERHFKLSQTWRKFCQAAEVNGIGIARRRQTREARYADNLCTQTDRFIAFDDPDKDDTTTTLAVKPPEDQTWPTPLTRHQIAFILQTVREQNRLPAIHVKRLKARNISQKQIDKLVKQIQTAQKYGQTYNH